MCGDVFMTFYAVDARALACARVCVCVCALERVCMCMRACMHAHALVCVCVCVCVYVCARASDYMGINVCVFLRCETKQYRSMKQQSQREGGNDLKEKKKEKRRTK